jgi:hypothetical protein
VEDHELHQSRRLLGFPPVTLEQPPPPLRQKLDQQGSFKAIGSQENVPNQHPEEPNISYLGEEALDPPKNPITDLGLSLSLNNPTSVNVYMIKGDAFISTREHDYSKTRTSEKGKETEIPSLPLQIEKNLGETMTRIPKGVFKKASHNPNTRAT